MPREGVGSWRRRFLCDSSGGSSCNGSSLGAGFNSDGGGSRSSGGRGSSRGRFSSLLGFVLALTRDVTGLRALIANLAGGAQRATVGSGAVTGDVTLYTINIIVYMRHMRL